MILIASRTYLMATYERNFVTFRLLVVLQGLFQMTDGKAPFVGCFVRSLKNKCD